MSEKNSKVIERHEIEDQFKWNLEDIYPTTSAWEADFQEIKSRIPKLEAFKDQLAGSAEKLLQCLELRDNTAEICNRLYAYANRKKDENTRVSESQSLFNRAFSLLTDFDSATAFIIPEILAIPEARLQEFLSANPKLAMYRQHIENITRVREHILSAEMERVVAMTSEMGSAPSMIFKMIDDADMKYPAIKDETGNEIEITKGRFLKFMQSKDRRVRKDAFQALYSSYQKQKNTIATTLASSIKADIFNARVRNYNSTLEAALDEDNIPVSVYHNLIQAVTENLEPMYKYVRLRKKLLGVAELHMYDIYVPVVKDTELEIPFKSAVETVIKAVAPLGKNYQEILQKGLNSRWVDVYENAGKTSGAYSAGVYGVHPYVLLNYNNTLNSMFTMAHEMGHALHSYFSSAAQPYVYHRYKIFLAEVASTLNEALLMNHLLEVTTDKNTRLYILNHFLEQFRATVYRQAMFAHFEMLMHEMAEKGEVLTHERLANAYYELNQLYYGPDMVVDEEIKMEWSRIPHFYANFYVYKYATGFAAATSLARQIVEEGQPAVERYLGFLKAGNSDYPINTLRKAGVDMTTPAPVIQALQTFRELVDEMEKLTAE